METKHTIVIVLRSGGDFAFRDVELIARHINGKWQSVNHPRIVCLWDKASEYYDLGNIELVPLKNDWPKWWSRMILYSPEMEQYRPFLYIDLDTVIIKSLENIFNLVYKNYMESKYITLEDFYQKGKLATGLAWIPANSDKIKNIWKAWQKSGPGSSRMDYFLRTITKQDIYWQQLTNTVYNSKPNIGEFLSNVPNNADLICFHGKPRIYPAAEASMSSQWVKDYVNQEFGKVLPNPLVTIIIPYKVDRGWLREAVSSVPQSCQLIVSQGEGNWPANFNKALPAVKGKYIKFLHEDDMLTPNCIEDSIKTMEEQNADFIHGNVFELRMGSGTKINWKAKKQKVTLKDLLEKNYIHSASLMYKKEIFDKIGGFNETLNTSEEYEFNLRCLEAGFKLGFCLTNLAIYRRHPAQKVRTVSMENKAQERHKVRKSFVA
jgi:hypothetical protein